MKFTPLQIQVLKNFSSINPSQFIYDDKFITYNIEKSVIGYYPTKCDFPKGVDKIGIYNTPQFLNILSTMGEASDIEIGKGVIKIKNEENTINYILSNETMAASEFPVDKLKDIFTLKENNIEFTLTQDKIAIISKILGVMELKKIYLEYTESSKKLEVKVETEKEVSMNNYILQIKDFKTNFTPDRKIFIRPEDLNLLYKGVDYKVTVDTSGKKALCLFKTDVKLDYLISGKFAENEY